ncbi:FAD-binding protein [Polymorphobacter sp.]|uniref:FAD-binding oxidoreductase n=1 Tax=Polymorphobacter sp. TaxID=1909290 RepID=UPI003F6EA93E
MIELLAGWGRFPRAPSELLRPARPADVPGLLAAGGQAIARGSARAYGDPAIGIDASLHTAALDRLISFDTATGRLHAEAGLRLIDLIPLVLPHGWFPPVVPGTRYPSLGGMIAADIHGKNHHRDGGFGAHVEAMRLLTASGEILDLTLASDPDLWRATIGGMGLTGIILSATIRMHKVETGLIRQTTVVAPNLADAITALDAADSAHYSVAWIDCSAKDASLGRSLVFVGEHATAAEAGAQAAASLRPQTKPPITFPIEAPGFALNRFTIAAFNHLYFSRGAKKAGAPFLVDHVPYFFPLDAIAEWNRVYGARGFVQHQCVLPPDTAPQALAAMMTEISARGLASPLAVLKKLGPGTGMLSFPMSGYTLALDFAIRDDLFAFLARLDAIVAEAGGRIYLAKDSCQPRALFEAGYPELDAFRAVRQRIDPARKFASHQSRRLGL